MLLNKHPSIPDEGQVVVEIIMDGVGIAPSVPGNAVNAAYTPNLDKLFSTCPHTEINAHGKAVGLPSDGDMGNSEVGHNALGAGRVFEQGAKLVNAAISSGSIFKTPLFNKIVERCKSGGTLHFIGLLSDGNVHSHINHLFAIMKTAVEMGISSLRVHPLLDGRDVGEKSSPEYLQKLEDFLSALRKTGVNAAIASGGGRMVVTMDRYGADWSIVERGYNAHVHGTGRKFSSALEAVKTLYSEDAHITDQFLPEFVITDSDNNPIGKIQNGDCVIFFNFRGDRAIEISRAFEDEVFTKFDRGLRPEVLYAGMMQYDGDAHIPANYLVDPPSISRTMGEYLAHNGISQFACAETQKFGHVTYFWNGNRSGKFSEDLEEYVEVESDRIPFEQRPWMKSAQVADEVIKATKGGNFRFIRANFANGDMVGHTGSFTSTVYAVESVDLAIGRILEAVNETGAILVVTADHGNADEMYTHKKGEIVTDSNGKPVPLTSHTLNKVIYLVKDPSDRFIIDESVSNPGLANNAATVISLLGYQPPEDFEPCLLKLR